MTQLLRRLGGACAAHPLLVIAIWVGVATATTTLAVTVGGRYSQTEGLPGTEVQVADQRLAAHFPAYADVSADVVLHASPRRALATGLPQVQRAVARLPHVVPTSVRDVRRSADGATALIHVRYDVRRFVLHKHDLGELRAAASSVPGVEGHVAGQLARDLNAPGNGLGEKVGIGVAVLVLLFAFGSVIAALMPAFTAAVAIVTGLGLVKLLANVYAVNGSAPALATMLGLGAGIDYALFIVTRHREALRAGSPAPTAAAAANATAGSSVLWAGVTVVGAICGLVFAGMPEISSLGFASAVVVAVSVASALTLLPALLSLTDRHIDYLHVPLPHLRGERVGVSIDPLSQVRETWWSRWAHVIERRPLRYLVGCLVVLVVFAAPVTAMRLGMPDGSSAAKGSEARRVYTLVAQAFGPGANAPLEFVVALPGRARAPAVGSTLRRAVGADSGIASTRPMVVSPDGTTGVLTAEATTNSQDARTMTLVHRLRGSVLPPVERATGSRVWVTGHPAGSYDVRQRVLQRLPWFVGAVLGLSFILLMLVFRSVLVPLKAVLLNLLSIAAALGVLVAVFTWGWLRAVLGVSAAVPIVDVVPMILFAIVFGLSMDYEVFLLSRVREEWVLGGDARGSVVRGLTSTARVISAAAAIMVCVFLAFTLSSDVIVKMMGLGLAAAVFLDATLIRLVLVPATMSLLGDLNWWLPRWLDRLLPHIDVEGAVPVTPIGPVPGPAQDTDAPMPRPTP